MIDEVVKEDIQVKDSQEAVIVAPEVKVEDNKSDSEFGELIQEYFQNLDSEGKIVKGIVEGFENNHAIIDVGLKSEGIIDEKELALDKSNETIKIGDEMDVYIESFEGRDGRIKLSRSRVLQEQSWNVVKEKFQKSSEVEGEIVGRVKGGFIVEVDHLTAFLPGSQVDVRPVKDVSHLIGFKQPFKVLKMDELRGNVVVSRRAVLEEGHQVAVDKILANINEGQEMEGVVKNITSYGAFIDLGTIDGLVHIADISWSRISHPSEILTLGQKIKVKVLKYDASKKQVSLGIKQLEHDPWGKISENMEKGVKLAGTVSNITDYGVFVAIEKGIEGLVHVSEISWSKGGVNQIKDIKVGQQVEVIILEIDRDKHRISLSMKRCENNPWFDFSKSHKVDDEVEGKIVSKSDFGFYLSMAENIDALLHFSNLSWVNNNYKSEASKYNIGDTLKVKILELDSDKEKFTVGLKQLTKSPFDDIEKSLEPNKRVTCIVTEIKTEGIEVLVNDNIPVFIKKFDLAKDKFDQRPDRFAQGEKIDAKVVKFDKETKKLQLSIKALEVEEENKAIEEYGSATSGASLGDILGDAFGDIEKAKKK